MQSKLEYLERTILELGSQIYRVKHQMDEMSKANSGYRDIFISLKRLLDEKGLISAEDFEDAVALDKILNVQGAAPSQDGVSVFAEELKKVVN
jgi:hypothetical protein